LQVAITHLFAGIPVTDYQLAVTWYERLLGRAPDVFPRQNEALWRVADTGSIYVVEDPARAGKALVTLAVDHLDDYLARLSEQGVAAGAIEIVPRVYRRTLITDREGNSIALFEDLGSLSR